MTAVATPGNIDYKPSATPVFRQFADFVPVPPPPGGPGDGLVPNIQHLEPFIDIFRAVIDYHYNNLTNRVS